jgi:FkbM family methyltransferase
VARLAEMAHENHWMNVTVVPEALSDVTGEAVFQAVADPALSHLMESSESESQGVRVPTMDFAAFARQHDVTRMHAMKLDVEGGEVRVLRGLSRWLKSSGCRPMLLVEVEERHLARAGTGVNDLLEAAPDGYVSIGIDYNAGGLMREPYTGQTFKGRNILMVPRESLGHVFRVIHCEEPPPSLR